MYCRFLLKIVQVVTSVLQFVRPQCCFLFVKGREKMNRFLASYGSSFGEFVVFLRALFELGWHWLSEREQESDIP